MLAWLLDARFWIQEKKSEISFICQFPSVMEIFEFTGKRSGNFQLILCLKYYYTMCFCQGNKEKRFFEKKICKGFLNNVESSLSVFWGKISPALNDP